MPPSMWRYFCCICDTADDNKRSYSAHYERSKRRKIGRRSKHGKSTWARRSLLDNEQIGLNEMSEEPTEYQMRAISTQYQDNEQTNEDSFQGGLLEHFAPKKRPTVHGIFGDKLDESSKTTFPWMDERFVPAGRNGTRLGISSIHLNAQRNGISVKPSIIQNTNSRETHSLERITKGQGFSNDHKVNYAPHVINSKYVATDVQNGHILWNNFNIKPREAIEVRRPLSLGVPSNYSNRQMVLNASTSDVGVRKVGAPNTHNEKPMVFRAPSSDVGVRRVGAPSNLNEKPMVLRAPSSDVGVKRVSSNQAPHRQDKIPKLEDYTGMSNAPVTAGNNVSVGQYRPSVMDIFPSNEGTETESEVQADVSYASEIIFRKQPSEYSGSEVSLKRSAGPGMFSSNANKYERLKPERSKSEKAKHENTTSKAKYTKLSDSMYGYVPKAVQNVHASNALEGTKIDDFFTQRMQERQLENFGSLDNNKVDNEEEPVIITSLVESTEDLTITGKTENDKKVTETVKALPTVSSECVSSENNLDKNDSKSTAVTVTKSEDSFTENNVPKPDSKKVQNTQSLDGNDEKVIMIDFPPNPESDKKLNS